MSTMTLEPCPFCGTNDHETSPWRSGRYHESWICNCGNPSCGVRIEAPTPEDAVARWNRRAPLAQPAQAVDVGAIREMVDRLRINPSTTAQECADSLAVALSGENAGDECHVEQIRSLVCNAADNLGDMPVSDAWARKWCEQAAPIIAKWISEMRYPASPAPDKEGA